MEPEAGVARAPYDREVGSEEEGGRDAGFWVLIAIAVMTATCAALSLLRRPASWEALRAQRGL